jgi:hypothetical protein
MQLINGQLNLYNGLNTSGSTIFTGSFNITGSLGISSSVMFVTTGSITANYMHLAKYINTAGDLDFNI